MEIKAVLNKPFTNEERCNFIIEQNYNNGYEIRETETELTAWGLDSTEQLQQAKVIKISKNDESRDEALYQGVLYRGVLFDSDTDQKTNLLAIILTMNDDDSIIWYGKDNQPLACNKQDLLNIGNLITQLHSFCWNRNAEIKTEINNANSIEELEAVEISYTMPIESEVQ